MAPIYSPTPMYTKGLAMKPFKILLIAVFVVCLVDAKETSAKDMYLSCGSNGNFKVATGWFGSKFYYEQGVEWVQKKKLMLRKIE